MIRQSRSNPRPVSSSSPYPGTFLLAFREAAGTMNWQIRRWLGQVVECVDGQGREQTVGLENLFRSVRREKREQWPTLIADFLSTVSTSDAKPLLPTDLSTAADKLLIRLGRPFQAQADDAKVWSRAVPDTGLAVNLVIDHPTRMCYVTEELINNSARPAEEWIAHALDNLNSRTPADCIQLLDEQSGVRTCIVGDAYDSSRALLLDRLLPENSANGFFVAVPNRDQLLILPVTREALKAVHLVKVVADKNYRGAPYPISPDVFWIRGTVWHRFDIRVRDREVSIGPPPAFATILEKLTAENDASDNPPPVL